MIKSMVCYKCGWSGPKGKTKRSEHYEECPNCNSIVNEVYYNGKLDSVIYGPRTEGFTREDWIELAMAALDQADVAFKRGDCPRLIAYIAQNTGVEPSWEVK